MSTINLEPFSAEERAFIATHLDLAHLPQHIAIIMDGNGRWATRQGLPRVIGHRVGVESVRSAVDTCSQLGISCITLYTFSTENWNRPDEETSALMQLIEQQLRLETDELHRKGARILHLGRRDGLPDSLCRVLDDAEALTRANDHITVQFAINYSGRAEIVDAMRRIAEEVSAGQRQSQTLTEEDVAAAMYHPEVPDPDLLIRTAGELRVSNYLLWQIAYSEIWVTPDLWPDFRTMQLLTALHDYQQRHRKFGGVAS